MRETVDATLREVARCTQEDIRINTFMLDANGHLKELRRAADPSSTRAGPSSPPPRRSGDYVLVDFIEQKRAMIRGAGGRRSA